MQTRSVPLQYLLNLVHNEIHAKDLIMMVQALFHLQVVAPPQGARSRVRDAVDDSPDSTVNQRHCTPAVMNNR
jgi:hypothetical protein